MPKQTGDNDPMKSHYYKTNLVNFHYLDSCSLDIQEPVVWLHGFTGSSRDFLTLPDALVSNYRCLIPDLPGHGQTQVMESENIFTADGQVALLERWLDFLGQSKFHLFGYSMGGRLALQFAVKNPHRLQSLTLVSTTAGIKKESARLKRSKVDEQLAQKIIDLEPVDFLKTWLTQPLFREVAALGQDFIEQEASRRLPLQPSGLAHSLKYFGSGVMPSIWHQIVNIKIPTLVIAGSKDEKYLGLASELVALISDAQLKVLPTGHAPLIESPDLLWKQVVEFLNSLAVESR